VTDTLGVLGGVPVGGFAEVVALAVLEYELVPQLLAYTLK